jgi:DNA repair exonuclease SbcCD ATPase subunit
MTFPQPCPDIDSDIPNHHTTEDASSVESPTENAAAPLSQTQQPPFLEPPPPAEPLPLPETLGDSHRLLRELEAQNQKLARELHSAREDLIQSLVALGDTQGEVAKLRGELAESIQDINDWRAFHEAMQNDLEQANALASDFRAQLSEKSNEIGQLRVAHEQATKATPGRDEELVTARQEVVRLQKALEHAMSLVRESAMGQVNERRQWEVTLSRVRDELATVQADNDELRRLTGGKAPQPSRDRSSGPLSGDDRDLNEALLEVELKIGRIRGQLSSGRQRQVQHSGADEELDVSFEP